MKPRYRIEWKINNDSGHGDWYASRVNLDEKVRLLNNEYGIGTHTVVSDMK